MPPSTLSRVVPTSFVGRTVTAGALAISLAYVYNTSSRGRIMADAGSPKKVFTSGPAFLSLPLESSEDVNHNTKKLRFSFPDKEAVSGLSTTSAILTLSWPNGQWFPVPRPYTPISSGDQPGYLELLVKKYPNGKASTHLHSLVPGDKLLIVAPIKGYQWKANSYSHITLIAGGAGVTPIYQLAKGILNNPSDKTAMTLVFGVNSDDDVLLRDEFARMEKDYPGRFKAVYSVSNPGPDTPFRKGKVTKALLEGVLPKLPDGEDTKVFLCGPPAMEAALTGSRGSEGILQQLGYRKSQIHRF